MIAVQIFINKNTLVASGTATDPNTSPFLLVKDITASYITNQFKGHYIKITEGTSRGSIAWIDSNTATQLTLATGLQVDTTSKYQIYRSDYQKLDLFKDEKISVTSQIANANDIGKVFTDFTQSFTIPASNRNNEILSHWYESSVDDGFDHRVRYDGYIEVNSQRFKDGNFQLDKASKKNGFIESYSVTFYGNLTQLKDIIQDDKLSSLDFIQYNHTWDSTNVISRIQLSTTTGDLKYPLIGSKRKFYYQDLAHPTEDITTNAGAILWNELFPAIKLSNIFLKIKAKYGIDFIGSFLNEDQWKNLYLYLKPATELTFNSERIKVDFTSKSGATFNELNLNTDVITTAWNFAPIISGSSIRRSSEKIEIKLTINPSVGYSGVPYTIYIYNNGALETKLENVTGASTNIVGYIQRYYEGPRIDQYSYYVSSLNGAFSYSGQLEYRRGYIEYSGSFPFIWTPSSFAVIPTTYIDLKIQIGNFMPDMKIYDFLNGIVKAFNLMIVPKGNNIFDLSHLEMYYNAGKIMDITEYVYSDEMEVERPKLYKAINFTYETSINVLNNQYKGLWGTNYGDLIYNPISSNESSSYDIKLPFENVLFEKPIGKPFETATIIDKDLKPYIPKPMLIYCNGIEATPLAGSDRIIINTPSGYFPINYWNRFSNEYDSFPADPTHQGLMTMNFGNEQSPWYNILAPKGLYFRHYRNYIENLYNIKTRIVKVKALFPPSLMTSNVVNGFNEKIGIALNDRLVIRNKRYIINSMTTDLTTGEANLELLTDYRGVNAAASVGYKYATYVNIDTDKEEISFDTNIFLNDYDNFVLKGAINFLSYPITGLPEFNDIVIPVTIPYNGGGVDRNDAIGIEYYKDGILVITEYITVLQTG